MRTTPPGRFVVLFDGRCTVCTAGAAQMRRLARQGAVEVVSFHDPGVLERFPGLTHEACMRQMHLVAPDGQVFGGFEAAVRVVATRRVLGRLALAYYLPGLRRILDGLYAWIAANRYRIVRRQAARCEGGTCALHGAPTSGTSTAPPG
jgi:predicted DCC family thiol-disulfide oxidoreductase YuxK